MTAFYFICACRSDDADAGLNAAGRTEARAAAQALTQEHVAAVYFSPAPAARETAELIAAELALDPVGETKLRPRIDTHALAAGADVGKLQRRSNEDRRYTPAGGDSAIDTGERLEDFALEVLRRPPSAAVVAVTHGEVLADFLLNISSTRELERVDAAFAANPYDPAQMPPGSITTLHFDGYSLQVSAIAERAHLDPQRRDTA